MGLETCLVTKKNLGKSKCVDLPNVWKTMIVTPTTFSLAVADYASDSALKTAFQNLILNGINTRGHLWPKFSFHENRSEEAAYEDTVLGMLPIRDGQYRFMNGISKSMCTHIALYTHRSVGEGRVFPVDVDNQIWGWKDPSDSKIRGFSLALLWTEKFMLGDGSSNMTKSPVLVVLDDNEEFDKYGVLIKTRIVNELEPLTDVDITVSGAFAAASFKVDVKQTCDQVPVSGLLVADFLMTTTAGAAQSISTAVEDANIPGRYTLTATTAFVDGSLTLRAPSLLTVKAYEPAAALTVDVP